MSFVREEQFKAQKSIKLEWPKLNRDLKNLIHLILLGECRAGRGSPRMPVLYNFLVSQICSVYQVPFDRGFVCLFVFVLLLLFLFWFLRQGFSVALEPVLELNL